jgi:hypothetical protein
VLVCDLNVKETRSLTQFKGFPPCMKLVDDVPLTIQMPCK